MIYSFDRRAYRYDIMALEVQFNFTAVESWGKKEIGTKGVSDGQKEGEWRGWGN